MLIDSGVSDSFLKPVSFTLFPIVERQQRSSGVEIVLKECPNPSWSRVRGVLEEGCKSWTVEAADLDSG